jgi:hypothetical protein
MVTSSERVEEVMWLMIASPMAFRSAAGGGTKLTW